jgi:hypothetical protein
MFGNRFIPHQTETEGYTAIKEEVLYSTAYPLGPDPLWGVKPTTHLHIVPRLRMRGAIPPLPQTSCCGVQLSTGYVFMVWYLVKQKTI